MKGRDKYKTHRFFRTFYVAVLLCAMFNGFALFAQAQPASRNVLVLNSYTDRNKWTSDIVAGIESVLNKDSDILFTEYMDTKKVHTPDYLEQLYDLYAVKYHDIAFDIVITTDDNAYQFALKYHDGLFNNAPIVFCGVSQFSSSQITGRPVTGILEKELFEETLAVALELQPQTKTIYVVCDHTVTASFNLERLEWILAEKYPATSYELLRDLTVDEMSAALASLPDDAIVLAISWWHDSTGRKIDPSELIRLLSGANRPVFGSSVRMVGHGSIGGKCTIALDHGRAAGEMARQVLAGADAGSMPVVDDSKQISVYMFDHLQLQKYQIPQSLLPKDAIIINAPERFSFRDRLVKQNVLGLVGGIAGFLGLVFSLVLFILHYRSIHRTSSDKELQFRNLVETTSDWIWEVDAEGHYTYVSPQVEAILGYSPEEIIGKKPFDLMGADEAGRISGIFAEFASKKASFEALENINLHKDGRELALGTSGVPIVDDKGRLTGYRGIDRDITERIQTQQKLRDNESALQRAQKIALLGFYDWDLLNDVVTASEGLKIFFGCEPDEALTFELVVSRVHPEDREQFVQGDLKTRTQGVSFSMDYRVLLPDGAIRWAHDQSEITTDEQGNKVRMFGVIQDITERKATEQHLQFTQFALDHAGDAAAWVGYDQKYIYVNDRFCEMHGYTHDELLQMSIPDIDPHYSPEDWDVHWDNMHREVIKHFEARHVRKDGTIFTVEGTSNFFTYEGKEYLCTFTRDITDRKAAEQQRDELMQQLQFTQFAFDHAGEAAHWVNRDQKFVYINEMSCHMHGYTRDELMQMSLEEIDPFYLPEDWDAHWDKLRQEGTKWFEARHKRKDGTVFPVEITSNFVTYEGNEYICSFERDITERKAVEKQREELMQQLLFNQFATDHAGEAAYWMGSDAKFIYVNDAACNSLNYTKEELLTMSVQDIDPDFPADIWPQHWQEVKENRSIRFESRHKTKDGYVFPVEVTTNFLEYAGREYNCAFVRDITDHKQAEEALQESENKHRLIFTSASDAIFILDGDRFIECNPQAVKLFGCEDASEIISKTPADFAPVYQEDGRLSSEVVQEKNALLLSGKSQRFPWVHRKKDRSFIYTEVSLNPIQLKRKTYVQAIVRDVTQERLAELERERLLKELQSKNEELQSIVFIASHDLRSPLVNIRGFTGELEKSLRRLQQLLADEHLSESAQERLADLFEADIPESLNFINAGNQKMDVLLNGLLRLSRVGAAQVHLTKLDMGLMFKGIVNNFHFRVCRDEIEITVDKSMPACRGDVVLINQVFTNLIDNAVKYRHPGRKANIHVSAEEKPEGVVYCVSDNGVGIEPEQTNKVFEVFHRLHPGEGEGEGLGLTIVARILDRQQGRIWIESEPDVGTSVYVQLPGV